LGKILREVKMTFKEPKKRKRLTKLMIIDTITTTIFWLVVHALKDIFIVGLTLYQTLTAAATGVVLNLLLGGIYGRVLDFVRKIFGGEKK